MLHRLKFHIFKWFAPHMVGRFRDASGKILPLTRVSNTTCIGNKENLKIEDNVFIGHYNFIDASCGMTIKTGCQITNFVSIITHSSHISIRLYGKEYPHQKNLTGYVKGSVSIGEYTFIGPHSLIMPGTNIGKGSIISAYSYVRGDFPDFSIISGNPAKVTGDTRDLDKSFLDASPELKEFYHEWANK